jgi:ABC-type glycerol-3-phosphate transport system substrate-binding protein
VHGVVIQIWNPWSGEAGEMLNTLAQEFTTQNEWKISVTAVPQPGYDAIDGLLEDGRAAPPDLAIAFAYQAAAWRAHPPLDWTPYLQDSLWGLPAAAQADFTAVFWQDGQVNQAQIGLPLLRSAQVLFYNQTWAADLAYRAAPQDPQTFADQACGATSALRRDATAENDGLGGFLASANDAAALSWMMSFGGGVISPTQSTITPPAYAFESEANIQAFTFLRELYEGGCVVFLENRDPLEAFAQRQGLMVGGSVMSIPSQAQIMFAMQNNDAWTVIPYPSPDETAAMVVYGPSLYLTASSPERRLASWLFARWLLEPTQHARLVRATASFPLSSGEMPLLADYVQQYPAYAAAVALLPHARPEPAWAGWARVRFALADAATQIFRPYFKVEQVPAMLRLLDRTAGELEQP